MRRIAIVIGVVVGVGLLALASLWFLMDPNRYRDAIRARLEPQLGRQVSLGEMSLGLLPFRFQVQAPAIADDPGIAQEPFLRADSLDIHIALLSLLRGDVQINSVELRRPSVELIRTKEGVWNFSTFGSTAGKTSGAESPEAASGAFTLDRLTIVDGQVGVTDMQANRPRSVYDHIDLTLLNYTPGEPFSFDLTAHMEGDGRQELRLKGEGGPLAAAPAETPFHGVLSLNQVAIAGLLRFLDSQSLSKAEGVLSGESEISSQSGGVAVTGKLRLEGAKFNSLDIGYPIDADFKLGAKIAESLMTIDNATVRLGQTPLTLTGAINGAATPPLLDLSLKSGDASIAELARLASAFGVAFGPGAIVNGRVRVDVQAKGPADKPALTGVIAGRDLQISGPEIPQMVQVKAVDLALSPAAIKSNEFTATSGNTTAAVRFSLLQYTSPSPSIDLGLRAPKATLPEIQSIARAYGVTGLDQLSGAGSLNLDLRSAGTLESLNATSMTRSLNGSIDLDFSPVRITGFDAAHELAKLGGFTSEAADQRATDILRVIGRIVVKNGVAQTDNLRAQLGIGSLSASGSADLATEALNLKVSAIFTKAFSDKAGGARIGNLVKTALSNSAGEFVLPAIVTGSFRQPKFSPDLKALAQLQKQRLLPTLENPGGAVSSIIDAVRGKKDNTATSEQEQPTGAKPSVLKGILDVLGGKRGDQPK